MTDKLRILFVDDDASLLQGLKRRFIGMRSRWEMTFESDPAKAIASLEESRFDVIVSDMRMPGINGNQVLEAARQHCPDSIRFVLSGAAALDEIVPAIGPCHQYMSKPCDPEDLRRHIEEAFGLRDRLYAPELVSKFGDAKGVPCIPETVRLVSEAISQDAPIAEIADIISGDAGMTAQLLRMVNSSYFGCPRQIEDVRDAARLLGTDVIQAVLVGSEVFDSFGVTEEFANEISRISRLATQISRRVCAEARPAKAIASQALIGCMLHQAGRLLIASRYPDSVAVTRISPAPETEEAEIAELGATYSTIGAYLPSLWSLPNDVIRVVENHGFPSRVGSKSLDVLAVTHISYVGALAGPTQFQIEALCEFGLDADYVRGVGISDDELEAWLAPLATSLMEAEAES